MSYAHEVPVVWLGLYNESVFHVNMMNLMSKLCSGSWGEGRAGGERFIYNIYCLVCLQSCLNIEYHKIDRINICYDMYDSMHSERPGTF